MKYITVPELTIMYKLSSTTARRIVRKFEEDRPLAVLRPSPRTTRVDLAEFDEWMRRTKA